MYQLCIEEIIETYPNVNDAMNDLLSVFPDASPDGDWKSDSTNTWMNIYVSNIDMTILGKIVELSD